MGPKSTQTEILCSAKVVLLVTSDWNLPRAAENETFQNLDFTDESSIWLGIAVWAE